MKKYYLSFFLIFFTFESFASDKDNIIKNLKNLDNISFNFEQNVNGKIEKGNCIIQYPKKIFCKYDLGNKKILVSNGKSLVIKTLSSYYIYPLEKTPLDLILDKNFIINRIKNLDKKFDDGSLISYRFEENNYDINIFFNKRNYNIIGWQTVDAYQNLSITYLSSIIKNLKLDKKLFYLPKQN
tara:strand:- start:389 stop:937 length:549 start_codon:yes stop_codon:yes gene_type:complete